MDEIAREVIRRCRSLATCSDEPGYTTRTFLSGSMRNVHADVSRWMAGAGMSAYVDPVGNIRGVYPAASDRARRLIIGSHLDTVPHAGAFDGVLGVLVGVALVESLRGRRLPFGIEVVGFSEEEGVRFGVPFIGSRALVGDVDEALLAMKDASGTSIGQAITAFGLDVSRIDEARAASNPRRAAYSNPMGTAEPTPRRRLSARRATPEQRRWTRAATRWRAPRNGSDVSRRMPVRPQAWSRQREGSRRSRESRT